MSRRIYGGLGLAAALLTAALLGAGALAQATASVEVQDQSGDGATVTVPQASISGSGGWVVIHADDGGSPGAVLGQTYIPEGESSDVTVELAQPLSSSQTLYAMIHEDNPADQQYTFPDDGDAPVQIDGEVVVKPFEVTLEAGTVPETGGVSLAAIALIGGSALLVLGLGGGYLARRFTA